ncbi:MAG: pre-peptidase C-terminal domain-containing protein [Nostocaceae cyanobacterium]|nr:pre-peptidase C-terminal domain-containing protein [Nostocaceae cyanobacterium]
MPAEFTLGTLNSNRTLNNFVGNTNTSDTFLFNLNSNKIVNLALTGLSADADLRLFRASSISGQLEPAEEITRSDGTGTRDEAINRFLTAGNYIAEVYQYSGNTNYTLNVSNNNTGVASNLLPTEVNVGTLNEARSFTGNVGNTNTADIYRFSLNSGSNVDISLTGLSADADIRLIRDINNNGIVDTGEVITQSRRFFVADESIKQSLAAGNYFVEVFQGTSNNNTHYRLGLSATAINSTTSGVDLVGQFGTVEAPDIRLVNDNGQAQVFVTNQGQRSLTSPVTVNLYASTDRIYNSNDELLGSVTLNVNLAPGQSQAYNFNFRNPTVVAPGAYNLLARIDANNDVVETNESNNLASFRTFAPGTDVVLFWNAVLLNAIQSSNVAPPLAARNQAIVHAAIYDAVNAIDRSHNSLYVNVNADSATGASIDAAAATAAHRTLSTLFPNLRSTFDEELENWLAVIPDGNAEDRGINIGEFVADTILNRRVNDGSAGAQTVYTPGTNPGDYQSTRTDDFVLLPSWGRVTPFAIPNTTSFRPSGPPVFGSAQYNIELDEVRRFGGINSTQRTADQTQIAQFWAYDRPDTFRPPGQWNKIAQTVALEQRNTVAQNARLFALLNIAQADSGIVSWDTKYTHNQLRPITAINNSSDPNWQSFLPTPPFPDYISGHATFGGAAAEVLTFFFGDNYRFTATSQELPGVYRTFRSFREAAQENAVSRVYAGVHIRSSNDDGVTTGGAVANYVVRNFAV